MNLAAANSDPASHGAWLARRPALLGAWCAVAAFGAYGCMYAFRKPFTAGGYGTGNFPAGFKTWLVLAQVLGYTLAKFAGIRVIAELPAGRRAATLLSLIGAAMAGLLILALAPAPWCLAGLFLNGLALGLVYGLVVGFLEGRRMTEALVAGLCASFILADGFTKSVGAWLLQAGVSEPWMPLVAGALFVAPLLVFVAMLQAIPMPTAAEVADRTERVPLGAAERRRWFRRHGYGLVAIVAAYVLVTILRSLRADFAPEIWAGLGAPAAPGVFTSSELFVALGVLAGNACLVWVRDHRRAFFLGLLLAIGGVALLPLALFSQQRGWLGTFPFMVWVGLGLYLPYVAVHTTIFERLIAMTRERGNLGYLMYLADAFGYLGYLAVLVFKNWGTGRVNAAGLFLTAGWAAGLASLVALTAAFIFFARRPAALRVAEATFAPATSPT